MCLTVVTKKIPTPTEKVSVAWKSFTYGRFGGAHFPYRAHRGTFKVRFGKWLKATHIKVLVKTFGSRSRYNLGFHCFSYKAGANGYTGSYKVKVLVKGVRTIGKQNGHKVVVADYMYVPALDEKIVGTRIVKVKGKKK